MKKILAIFATLALTAGCSGTPEGQKTAKAANEEGKICKYEKVTGSNIGTRICRTPEQIKREQIAAKELIRTSRASGPVGEQ